MQQTIEVGREDLEFLSGRQNRLLKRIREACGVRLIARDESVRIIGGSRRVERASRLVEGLLSLRRERGRSLSPERIEEVFTGPAEAPAGPDGEATPREAPVPKIAAKSPGQQRYLDALSTHDLVFCIGPAGTGKTYLATAMAVSALRAGQVRKIVLVRPAVEAGERLGFLPGDYQAKVNPYLRPIYDALEDLLEFGQLGRFVENDVIEIAPLAYMRGRTLDRAFIILDEAQNCTRKQMKMFLTRLGATSKTIVTGDVTQVDLPPNERSGLLEAEQILRGIEGIAFVYLDKGDVVRHRLVRDIVRAYEKLDGINGP